jgi:molecular chaperone DnaK (HSP70)
MSEHQASTAQSAAVVAVPTAFDEGAREATCQAVLLAGFAEAHVLEEPIATAIAYATIGGHKPKRALVYDLGGGTFDLSVLDCAGPELKVLAHAGDTALGGDDIDRAIGQWVNAQVVERVGWDMQSDPETRDRLLGQCDRAKIRLGFAPAARIALSEVDPAAPAGGESVTLTREQLAEIARPFVQRTFALADEALRDSGVRASEIEVVYLAGGATLLPSVREGVAAYFGSLPRCDFDPMEVIALGASLHVPGRGRPR